MTWVAVAVASAGVYALKLAGLSLPESVLTHPLVRSVATLLPVALLAALVAVGTVDGGGSLGADARLAGLAAAVVALLLRAPFVLVLVVAATTTAVVRAVV